MKNILGELCKRNAVICVSCGAILIPKRREVVNIFDGCPECHIVHEMVGCRNVGGVRHITSSGSWVDAYRFIVEPLIEKTNVNN